MGQPNRAIDPASKLAAAEWASHDVAIPGLEAIDEDLASRAMDLLVEVDTDASVQEAVFSPSRTCSTCCFVSHGSTA